MRAQHPQVAGGWLNGHDPPAGSNETRHFQSHLTDVRADVENTLASAEMFAQPRDGLRLRTLLAKGKVRGQQEITPVESAPHQTARRVTASVENSENLLRQRANMQSIHDRLQAAVHPDE